MKSLPLALSALALTAALAAPAAAQVNGVGVTDPSIAIASSQALQNAYQQIGTTFAAQRTQLDQLQQQRDALVRQFDTNGDGQMSDAEQTAAQANATAVQQLQTLEQTVQQTQQPINLARIYAIEQIAMQYGTAVQNVVTANNVSLIVTPGSVVYAAEAADVTDEITAQLNTLVPTVSTSVPAGWQPQRQSVTLFQEIQQLLVNAAAQQAAQQQAAPATPVQGR
ncbi:MAG TPA: OmpH family outer membrane protein [Croceibacterium sp.]